MSRSKQSSDDQSELDTDNETVVDKDENSALNIRRSIVKWLKKSSNFVNLYKMSKQEQHKTLKRFSEYFTKRHKVLINLIKDLTNTPKHYLETMNKEYEKLKSAFVRDYSKCLLFEEIDEICSFQQENEFQLTSKSVDTQMQELKKQEGSIKRARSDIIKRDKALNKREKKIDQRYADITAKEVALEKRAKNMDKKRKNLRKLLQKRVQHSNAGQSTTLLDEKLMQFQ